ncbi:hypothetical protein ACWF99_23635 [Nocardia sp. NPDC055002]
MTAVDIRNVQLTTFWTYLYFSVEPQFIGVTNVTGTHADLVFTATAPSIDPVEKSGYRVLIRKSAGKAWGFPDDSEFLPYSYGATDGVLIHRVGWEGLRPDTPNDLSIAVAPTPNHETEIPQIIG